MAKTRKSDIDGITKETPTAKVEQALQHARANSTVSTEDFTIPHGFELVSSGYMTIERIDPDTGECLDIVRNPEVHKLQTFVNNSGGDITYHVRHHSGGQAYKRPISAKGQEKLDPIPHSLAVNEYIPTIHDEIRRFIREEMHMHDDYRDEETFEDANDFDIDDDDYNDMLTQYEVLAMQDDGPSDYNPDKEPFAKPDDAGKAKEPPLAKPDEAGKAEVKDTESPPEDQKTDA
jgi:hypothetical protein